jgi:hypothetical protein
MCIIQAYGYDVNGSHVDNPCTVDIGNKIEVEVVVTFDRADIGKSVLASAAIIKPDGLGYEFYSSSFYVYGASTETLVVNITKETLAEGLYKLHSTYIRTAPATPPLCWSDKPTWCSLLTIKGVVIPNAQIFNWCWDLSGKLGTGACSIPTTMPAVRTGSTIDIRADIANGGPAGRIMANFEIDGVVKYTETNVNLATFPGGGLWSPTYKGFAMPSKNVLLAVKAYNWNGVAWVIGQTKTSTISTSAAGCTGIDLVPFSASIKTGEKVGIATAVSPGNVSFVVTFKDRIGTVLGTCKTSGTGIATGSSACDFVWDSNVHGKGQAGTYYVKAYADSCYSTETVIVVDAPILQYNFSATVVDSATGVAVSGATVLVGTTGGGSQSKITDANGLATFRVDAGTISISISNNGYNTTTDAQYVFSDKNITYQLIKIPPKPTIGDIEFVSVPTGADIYIDGKSVTTVGAKTPATITGIPAGSHTWTLKLTGYNDSSGTISVPSGGVVQIYTTLTVVTPTSGSLNITSHPVMGAEVWIDGKDTGLTTSGMTVVTDIPPGGHIYTLTLTGFKDATGTFSIKAGQTTFLDVELLPLSTIGTLEVTSEPSGARIYIDDKDTQRVTPGTVLNLVEGDHKYKIVLNGYKDVSGIVTIIAGATGKIHLILEKAGPGLEILAAVTIAGVAVLGFVSAKE